MKNKTKTRTQFLTPKGRALFPCRDCGHVFAPIGIKQLSNQVHNMFDLTRQPSKEKDLTTPESRVPAWILVCVVMPLS